MSRTFRYIPHYMRTLSSIDRCRERLAELGYIECAPYYYEDTDRLFNGYDNRKGQTSYRHSYLGRGWGASWNEDARRFFKRRHSKGRRSFDKYLIKEEME